MQQHDCTIIPSGRISVNGSVELNVASMDAVSVNVTMRREDGYVRDCGTFPIQSGRVCNHTHPDFGSQAGRYEVTVSFLDEAGAVLGVRQFPYELVSTKVTSTQMLDGCWVSICHWSDFESQHFQQGLKSLTAEQWKQKIYSMHKAKITSVLIQNVFDSTHYVHQHDMTVETYDGKAFYDSKLYSNRQELACEDPIEAILSAADECDMSVFPGVGLFAWFDFSEESLKWHKNVALELHQRYGHHKSFYGWYVSEEIMGALYYGYPPVPDEKYKDIQVFFREFTAFIRELTPTKPVALAPNNIDMHHYEEEWLPILENIDILIPFAFARSEYNVAEIAAMCRKTGTHFWVDFEMFAFPFPDGLRPKKVKDMLEEMQHYNDLEQIYGYQYTGIMNEPGYRYNLGGEETEEFYRDYMAYLERHFGFKA